MGTGDWVYVCVDYKKPDGNNTNGRKNGIKKMRERKRPGEQFSRDLKQDKARVVRVLTSTIPNRIHNYSNII